MRTARVVNMVIMPARVSACAGMGANCGPRHAGQRGRSCARQRRGPLGGRARATTSSGSSRPAISCEHGLRTPARARCSRLGCARRRVRGWSARGVRSSRQARCRLPEAASETTGDVGTTRAATPLERSTPPGAAQLRRQRQRLRKGAEGMRAAGRAARAPPVRADQLLEGRSVFRRALLSYLVPPPLFGRSSCLRARARAKRRQKSANPRCRRGDGCGGT